MAESLEFGGSGEPFPPEGERVSPKIKMKTFPSLYVTLCIREWFKRGENSDAIQESKALIQTGKLGLRNYIPLRQMNVFLASLFNAALGGFTGWCRSLLQPPPTPPLHLFCLFLKLNFAREDFWFVHTAAAKKFRSQGLHPNFPAALPATLFPKGDSDCQLVFPLATISVADKMSLDFTFFIHLWDGVNFPQKVGQKGLK